MSFIELPGIEDVHEPQVAPEDEYELCIVDAQLKEKDGKKNIFVVMEIESDDADYANVMHNVSLPGKDDDENKRKTKMLFIKRFCHQFNIPLEGGLNLDAFVGSRGRGKLGQDEYEGRLKNILKVDSLPSDA